MGHIFEKVINETVRDELPCLQLQNLKHARLKLDMLMKLQLALATHTVVMQHSEGTTKADIPKSSCNCLTSQRAFFVELVLFQD